jgi:hypothetical protein
MKNHNKLTSLSSSSSSSLNTLNIVFFLLISFLLNHTHVSSSSSSFSIHLDDSSSLPFSYVSSPSAPQPLMTVLYGAEIYSPTPLGQMDILIGGTKILAMTPSQPGVLPSFIDPSLALFINVTGMYITPGIIDVHVHVTGGGGELGPYSRTPEAELSQVLLLIIPASSSSSSSSLVNYHVFFIFWWFFPHFERSLFISFSFSPFFPLASSSSSFTQIHSFLLPSSFFS